MKMYVCIIHGIDARCSVGKQASEETSLVNSPEIGFRGAPVKASNQYLQQKSIELITTVQTQGRSKQ
jgi:hypothetical protein